jgi:predicted transcriptional regulator
LAQADEKLKAIAAQLKQGVVPPRESVRSFLMWFGAQRRGYYVIRGIRSDLRRHGLTTVPDFESAYIDGTIGFTKAAIDEAASVESALDPTYRLSLLASAHQAPISVPPDATLEQVVTLMMSNDFSQLPVMTGTRDLKGIVSWKTIGARLALKRACIRAADAMENVNVLRLDDPLFSAIEAIASHDYVLVQAADKVICGIVTASDLNNQFRLLAEPFLLVGEIENGIRRALYGKFTKQELESAKAPGENNRVIETPADLTFGEYIQLLQQPQFWAKLKLAVDRVEFVRQLERVRNIRNDVMHFDPEGLGDEDLRFLREFALFLKRLRDVGAV